MSAAAIRIGSLRKGGLVGLCGAGEIQSGWWRKPDLGRRRCGGIHGIAQRDARFRLKEIVTAETDPGE